MKEIKTRSHIEKVIAIPGSKSITHRALITAGLAQGQSLLKNFLTCEDTLYTINGLREMGIEILVKGKDVAVRGNGGKFSPSAEKKEIFLGNSGTSYRLLLSVAALARGEYILNGTPRMCKRPVGDLVRALNGLGGEAEYIQDTKKFCSWPKDYILQ